MRRGHGSDLIVLALIGVLALMLVGLFVVEIITVIDGRDANLDSTLSTVLATAAGGIIGAAAGYVTQRPVKPEAEDDAGLGILDDDSGATPVDEPVDKPVEGEDNEVWKFDG